MRAALCGINIVRLHCVHSAEGRPAAGPENDGFHAVSASLDQRLNPPIRKIAHPAGDGKVPRHAAHGGPVSDTLNVALDQNMQGLRCAQGHE